MCLRLFLDRTLLTYSEEEDNILGQGGSGTIIYRARYNGQPVAIKRFHSKKCRQQTIGSDTGQSLPSQSRSSAPLFFTCMEWSNVLGNFSMPDKNEAAETSCMIVLRFLQWVDLQSASVFLLIFQILHPHRKSAASWKKLLTKGPVVYAVVQSPAAGPVLASFFALEVYRLRQWSLIMWFFVNVIVCICSDELSFTNLLKIGYFVFQMNGVSRNRMDNIHSKTVHWIVVFQWTVFECPDVSPRSPS